ncbi:hypothetical protein Naga_100144g14 [Nannochloropsis gaditana]|uniref:Uncharacterized protein n=1 Tax=Nannochloropsis gaditana TaxID=72520 RepID=W7U1H7_9STRA|nr:hypothetical protein Naga_100144g14 [Nannochloropsis gaditana]
MHTKIILVRDHAKPLVIICLYEIQGGLTFVPCSGIFVCFPMLNLVKAMRFVDEGGRFQVRSSLKMYLSLWHCFDREGGTGNRHVPREASFYRNTRTCWSIWD